MYFEIYALVIELQVPENENFCANKSLNGLITFFKMNYKLKTIKSS